MIAALVEKSITTPQYYPLSSNALVAACNQKNAREPVMVLTERDVGGALNALEELRLVKRDDQLGRVPKWRHRFNHEMLLKDGHQAVLVCLLLRGAQTVSELRANAAPLNGPADVQGVQAVLEDLADRAQPLVAALPRQAGQAAPRFAHLLSGVPEHSEAISFSAAERAPAAGTPGVGLAALIERIVLLEARVAALESIAPSGDSPA